MRVCLFAACLWYAAHIRTYLFWFHGKYEHQRSNFVRTRAKSNENNEKNTKFSSKDVYMLAALFIVIMLIIIVFLSRMKKKSHFELINSIPYSILIPIGNSYDPIWSDAIGSNHNFIHTSLLTNSMKMNINYFSRFFVAVVHPGATRFSLHCLKRSCSSYKSIIV